ncbi:MAG TPA: hypothetical protein VFQ67_04245 [Allosphingosinicella sp.]|nr:hypothetical protein [Allosphingosinicella sp.]
MTPLLTALLLASAPPVSIQPLDDGWFRLTVTYKPSGIQAHADAQGRLIAAASRLCKGKGRPVSEGSLDVDEMPVPAASGGSGRRLALSERWRCGAAAATGGRSRHRGGGRDGGKSRLPMRMEG